MGAWDDGLLDNDSAQDYLGSFASHIQREIIEIGDERSRKIAGKVSASVGILLRLSFGFDPIPGLERPPHFYPRLLAVISHNIEHLLDFPGDSPQLLAAVLKGHGEELASREAKLDKAIHGCLFGGRPGILQGAFSRLETDLFTHPSSRAYMKSKTKELVAEIDYALRDRQTTIDLSYSYVGGMLGLILVLPLQGLKKSKIEKWRKHCHKIWESDGANDEANDLEFEIGFRKNVGVAFDCAAKIYANGG